MLKWIVRRILKKKNGKYRKSAITLMAIILAALLSELLGVNVGQDELFQILSNLLNS